MKCLIVFALFSLLAGNALADRSRGTAEHFSMVGNKVGVRFTGDVVEKLSRDMNRVSADRQGYRKGQHITCLRKVCTLMISDKTTGRLASRPDVLPAKFTTKGPAIVYDYVGTNSQGTLSVYGPVAEKLFNEMGQATIEWRMSANGSMQKVGSRYSCERTITTQPRRSVQHSCSFFIEDKASGKIGPAPMG